MILSNFNNLNFNHSIINTPVYEYVEASNKFFKELNRLFRGDICKSLTQDASKQIKSDILMAKVIFSWAPNMMIYQCLINYV